MTLASPDLASRRQSLIPTAAGHCQSLGPTAAAVGRHVAVPTAAAAAHPAAGPTAAAAGHPGAVATAAAGVAHPAAGPTAAAVVHPVAGPNAAAAVGGHRTQALAAGAVGCRAQTRPPARTGTHPSAPLGRCCGPAGAPGGGAAPAAALHQAASNAAAGQPGAPARAVRLPLERHGAGAAARTGPPSPRLWRVVAGLARRRHRSRKATSNCPARRLARRGPPHVHLPHLLAPHHHHAGLWLGTDAGPPLPEPPCTVRGAWLALVKRTAGYLRSDKQQLGCKARPHQSTPLSAASSASSHMLPAD